jgi:hypothetical protein
VIVSAIEPPDVRLEFADPPRADAPVRLRLTAAPRGDGGALELAQLWVNDHLLRTVPLADGRLAGATAEVAPAALRAGLNTLTLRCFNKDGVFADAPLTLQVAARPGARGRLFGLCVGVGEFGEVAVAGPKPPPVPTAAADARLIAELLAGQRGGSLFRGYVQAAAVVDGEATRAGVRDRLADLRARIGPDDWLVLFLAGRADAAGSAYLCHDGPLPLDELRKELTAVPGRKLILMDVRPPGDDPPDDDPLRSLTAGLPLLAFAACRSGEVAADEGGQGLFALVLHEAAAERFAEADADGDDILSTAELARYLRLRVPARFAGLRRPGGAVASTGQHPIFYRQPVGSQPLLARR